MLYSLTHVILQINPKSFIQENNYRLKERKKGCGEDGCSGNHVDPTVSPPTSPFILFNSPLPFFTFFFLIFSPILSEFPSSSLSLSYSNRWAFFDFDPKYWFLFFPSQFRPLRFEYYRQSHLGFVQIQGIVESFSLPIQNWNESFIL